MRVLSVDWDYFFPDLAWMDWGHNESALHIHFLWSLRCGDFNLHTKQSALDFVQPDTERLNNFWSHMLAPHSHPEVLVSESHLDLALHLSRVRPALGSDWKSQGSTLIIDQLDNYDQHHDCGYDDDFKGVDCGSWASHLAQTGQLKTYRLHYPVWRKKTPERSRKELQRRLKGFGRYDHDLPPAPAEYDLVFVCRSGGWTPSWCDAQFYEFIKALFRHCTVGKYEIRFADKENDQGVSVGLRHPNMAEALVIREDMLRQRQAMLAGLHNNPMKSETASITSLRKK